MQNNFATLFKGCVAIFTINFTKRLKNANRRVILKARNKTKYLSG